jgi:hypothetical protein
MWETLNTTRNVDEKVVRGDQITIGEFENEEFHTPISPMKDNIIVTP